MSREIGVARALSAVLRRSVAGGLAVTASALCLGSCIVWAAEPGTPNRFSESGMLDAARGATRSNDGHSVNIGIPPPDELRVLEARREAELKRLSEKLKRAEARGGAHGSSVEQPWSTEVATAPPTDFPESQRSALGASPQQPSSSGNDGANGRATVLLIMAPRSGHPENQLGIDPILCLKDGCYVSNGAQAPATYYSFKESTSLSGRIGRGAGSCNHSSVCVFRDVDIGAATTMVQPIDLKFVHHDRREQSEVGLDQTCRLIENQLSCSRPVRTASYTIWVVPESVARTVGPEKLTAALGSGLRTARTAELPWAKP